MWEFSRKSEKKVFDPFFKIFLTNPEKMKMKMEKYGK